MSDETQETCRDWSKLPVDILYMFLQHLNNTDTDCRRLRAVCTSWRSSLRPPTRLFPLKVLLHTKELVVSDIDPRFKNLREMVKKFQLENNVGDIKQFGLLRQSIFYLISSPNQRSSSSSSSSSCGSSVWLTRVEETLRLSTDHNTWKLQNPLSGEQNFRKLPQLKAVVNSLEYRISEVATSYYLPTARGGSFCSLKTVILLCPSSQDYAGANFSILTLSTRNLSNTQDLMLFSPGEEKWVNVPEVRSSYSDTVNDILAYKGKFYAVDFRGKLIAIDPITCQLKEVIKSQFEEENCDGLYCYLVESCGRLYLVQKTVHYNFFHDDRFDEYEADYDNGKPLEVKVFALAYSCSPDGDISHHWEPITSLEDRVFFVSDYITFSVSAQEFGWDQGNCIYFSQEEFRKSEYSFETYELEGIFFESKPEYCGLISKYCGLYTLEDCKIVTANDLSSKYTSLFWPVPSWLGDCPNN